MPCMNIDFTFTAVRIAFIQKKKSVLINCYTGDIKQTESIFSVYVREGIQMKFP